MRTFENYKIKLKLLILEVTVKVVENTITITSRNITASFIAVSSGNVLVLLEKNTV